MSRDIRDCCRADIVDTGRVDRVIALSFMIAVPRFHRGVPVPRNENVKRP